MIQETMPNLDQVTLLEGIITVHQQYKEKQKLFEWFSKLISQMPRILDGIKNNQSPHIEVSIYSKIMISRLAVHFCVFERVPLDYFVMTISIADDFLIFESQQPIILIFLLFDDSVLQCISATPAK